MPTSTPENDNATVSRTDKAVVCDALVRLPYTRNLRLDSEDTLIVKKRGGGERRVPPDRWWINRNTPVGEDADLMERMPHNGYRYLPWGSLIAVERSAPNAPVTDAEPSTPASTRAQSPRSV